MPSSATPSSKPHRRATRLPAGSGVKQPWGLAPFRSRGQFSPRLLMAWVILVFMLWLIRRWITTPPLILEKILVQPRDIGEIVGILAALIAALLSLGTLQKIRLTTPSPDEADDLNEAPVEETKPDEAEPLADSPAGRE